jgi:hypothetical protein
MGFPANAAFSAVLVITRACVKGATADKVHVVKSGRLISSSPNAVANWWIVLCRSPSSMHSAAKLALMLCPTDVLGLVRTNVVEQNNH